MLFRSSDWANTLAMIQAFPGLEIFSGTEVHLLQNISAGGAGCISATANFNARGIRAVIDAAETGQAEDPEKTMIAIRKAFEGCPVIPALKAQIAKRYGDPEWVHVRPPLTPMDSSAAHELSAALKN